MNRRLVRSLLLLSILLLLTSIPLALALNWTGEPFPIGPQDGDKYQGYAAMNPSGRMPMVVAWSGDAYAQRLNYNGTPLGSPIPISTEAYVTDVAMDRDGNFVVVWQHASGVMARCYTANGEPRGSAFSVDSAGYSASSAAIEIARDGRFVVVWTETSYGGVFDNQIQGKLFSATCAAIGQTFLVNNVNTGEEFNPDIAMDANGNFIVVWDGVDDHWSGVFARRFSADGTPRGNQFRVNQRQRFSQWDPSVAMDAAGNAVIVWNTEAERLPDNNMNYDVLVRRYSAAGLPLGNEFGPYDASPAVQYLPQVAAAADGRFAVMWTVYENDRDLRIRTFSAAGTPLEPVSPVTTSPSDEHMGDLVASGNTFLVVWPQRLSLEATQLWGRLFSLDSEGTTFLPTNDAYVLSSSANGVFNRPLLSVKDAAADMNSYVKFNLQGLNGPVQSAKLRLYVKDAGPDGGNVYATSPFYKATTTQWLETGLTWRKAPLIEGAPLATIGPVLLNKWVEVDVTSAVQRGIANQNGRVSFAITNDSTNLISYSSKEGANPPELVVVTAP